MNFMTIEGRDIQIKNIATINISKVGVAISNQYEVILTMRSRQRLQAFVGTKEACDEFRRKLIEEISPSNPFLDPKPLDSISLCFYGDSTGIKMWNNPNDPMPIKTTNMAGLQKLEETEDYTIYIDKDAVMTTVAKYAPGSYQTFMERKADVDSSISLLKGYNIEWTQKDDSDLFIQCNDEAISKIESQPRTLDEPTPPVVLGPRAVPTTYECCFRMDKKSGEFYIGEGYENLAIRYNDVNDRTNDYCHEIIKYNDESLSSKTLHNSAKGWYQIPIQGRAIPPNTNVSLSFKSNKNLEYLIGKGFNYGSVVVPTTIINLGNKFLYSTSILTTNALAYVIYLYSSLENNFETIFSNMCLTKTSTPKPWVKTIQPTCKLDRITNANEATHTFLNKGDGVVTFGNGYFSLKGEKIQQFLVYNALLTEQEKQTELAKDIKLR